MKKKNQTNNDKPKGKETVKPDEGANNLDEIYGQEPVDYNIIEESEDEQQDALSILYGDRKSEIEKFAEDNQETDNEPSANTNDELNVEFIEREEIGTSGNTAGAVVAATARTPAVAVRRIREESNKSINKFDNFFIKLWSYIVAFVVGTSDGINWCVQAVFKKKLPDKYVRAFVAAVIIILLLVLFTVPFSIEIKTEADIEIYSEGMLPVCQKVYVNNETAYRWGYINEKGKLVIEPKYFEALPFMHKVAWVRTVRFDNNNDKIEDYWSLIDKKGRTVGKDPLKFDTNPDLDRPVGEFTKDSKLAWVYTAGKYGYVKSNGAFAITPRYEYAEDFSNGLARVKMGSVEFYINKRGDQVGSVFTEVKSFTEEKGAVMMNGIWGFVNTKGDMIIDPQYNDVSRFKGGYAAVRNGEAYGIIDAKGKTVIEPIRYNDLLPMSVEFRELIDALKAQEQ